MEIDDYPNAKKIGRETTSLPLSHLKTDANRYNVVKKFTDYLTLLNIFIINLYIL